MKTKRIVVMRTIIFFMVTLFLQLTVMAYSQNSILAMDLKPDSVRRQGKSNEKTERDTLVFFPKTFFSNIRAAKRNDGVKVVWTLESADNGNYFVIERSKDGKNFQPIGSLKVKKSLTCSKVEYTDDKPLSGINYYRVKQISFKNGHQYSEVIRLSYTKLSRE